MAEKKYFADTTKRIQQDSKDLETTLGKSISDRYKKAISTFLGDFSSGFPYDEVESVIKLAKKIIRAKGIEEFEKIVGGVWQILQEGYFESEDTDTDHHGMPIGEPYVTGIYSEKTGQKIMDYTNEVVNQIRRVTCKAGLELNVEIKKDKATEIIDEIRQWDSKETMRESNFPNLEIVLCIEGEVKVPIDNVRYHSIAPKKFEIYGRPNISITSITTGHLNPQIFDLVAKSPEERIKTKALSGFICHGINDRCYDACKYYQRALKGSC